MKLLTRLFCCTMLLHNYVYAQTLNTAENANRWAINGPGSIRWTIDQRLPHEDHIEMAGLKSALWLRYGVDTNGASVLNRTLVFPTFRLIPNNTHASMMYTIGDKDLPRVLINNKPWREDIIFGAPTTSIPEKVQYITHDGITTLVSAFTDKDGSLLLKHSFFPSVDKPLLIEKMVFVNNRKTATTVEMEGMELNRNPSLEKTSDGPLHFVMNTNGAGLKTLQPGDSAVVYITYQAIRKQEKPIQADLTAEEKARRSRIAGIEDLMQLETPDTLLNTAFHFAKLRATESIYLTKGGYMHGPGGLRYYAAIWANDQAEYVNPFFGFLGDDIGAKSAMNSYRWFASYMNPAFNPIPSSIVAEGDGIWHGRRDRGDMAMIAYGASRFAMAQGDADSARVLWPLIEWCLEYLQKNVNQDGVVFSDSDELEGRFPAGKANLNTSALYYDALCSASMLGQQLHVPAKQLADYKSRAVTLKNNIDKYFGANIEGYNTYRYYAENTVLRAWIATPLVTGIMDRKEGTIAALFSPKLWTEDGVASQSGDRTFWDRSTLYALRGVLAAGETEKALKFLDYYSNRRLLGEHVPYPVEAYPEGNQRHLSAESGLYCRIFTEGMFGMRPTGLNSFDCTPRLPAKWNRMSIKNIHAFGKKFDLMVNRKSAGKLLVTVTTDTNVKAYTINDNATLHVTL
ncbi:hypothetical protein CLV59_102192 [Chitinophaga dinghuensis]|uniref:Alpha-L-rhamnosidase six-hairpin glycosidase domain-containing protein n=1 Tax=Chitinophaga dinghuensis TaxID=1539050 RepID=A0A327W4P0_9BACT|nr:hypothetical protein [Chitinophaga dinghuensis]RAJ85489.1 hypothetical protein CLV59_102192 [Chitinophaga dinghuensis]